jgi:hypothetical protein
MVKWQANQKSISSNFVFYNKFDVGRSEYEESYNFANFKKWVNEKTFTSFIAFNDRAIKKIF